MRGFGQWKWHHYQVYVKINGELHYLWLRVGQGSEILEIYVSKTTRSPGNHRERQAPKSQRIPGDDRLPFL